MLGYVTIGVPCGVMAAEVGLGPGGGVSALGDLLLGRRAVHDGLARAHGHAARLDHRERGAREHPASCSTPPPSRPTWPMRPARLSTVFAATVTDESFGVNLERFAAPDGGLDARPRHDGEPREHAPRGRSRTRSARRWVRRSPSRPRSCRSPMTSIFVCLLVTQRWSVVTRGRGGRLSVATVVAPQGARPRLALRPSRRPRGRGVGPAGGGARAGEAAVSATEFLIFYVCVLAVILACRCVPLLTLKGRELSPPRERGARPHPAGRLCRPRRERPLRPVHWAPSWTALVAAARSGRGGEKDRVGSSGARSSGWPSFALLSLVA